MKGIIFFVCGIAKPRQWLFVTALAQNKQRKLILAILIIWAAALFSTIALHHARRFHPDEALYMTMARNAAVNGDWWLISLPLDKPPLTYYTNALSLNLLAVDSDASGVLQLDVHKGEFAGRMPSLLMSVLLVAVVVALAKALCKDACAAWFAGVLTALSPLRIVFAPTAFTDMPMLLFATVALWMAARGRWACSGLWMMVSVAAKPQSVFYLPLIVAFVFLQYHRTKEFKRGLRHIIVFAGPLILGGLLLLLWDVGREAQGAANIWAVGYLNYTPTRITPFADYASRWHEWWKTANHLFGDRWLTIGLLGIAAFGTVLRRRLVDWILLSWLVGFCALHMLLTLNLFDRNLILMLPIAAVWVANIGSKHIFTLSGCNICKLVVTIIILLWLTGLSYVAATGAFYIGGDDGTHDGIDVLADYLSLARLGVGILYGAVDEQTPRLLPNTGTIGQGFSGTG